MTDTARKTLFGYSPRVDAALRFAAAAHHEDVRKGTQIPYVMHPFHVGLILDRHGFEEDVVIAGILHDTLEDPKYEKESVQGRLRAVCPLLTDAPASQTGFKGAVVDYLTSGFGPAVAQLVSHVSEEKTDETGTPIPWKVRKTEQLRRLREATPEHCAVKAADCLHNLRSMIRDIQTDGATSMERFSGGPEGTLWFHSEVTRIVAELLGSGHPLAAELNEARREFEECLAAATP